MLQLIDDAADSVPRIWVAIVHLPEDDAEARVRPRGHWVYPNDGLRKADLFDYLPLDRLRLARLGRTAIGVLER